MSCTIVRLILRHAQDEAPNACALGEGLRSSAAACVASSCASRRTVRSPGARAPVLFPFPPAHRAVGVDRRKEPQVPPEARGGLPPRSSALPVCGAGPPRALRPLPCAARHASNAFPLGALFSGRVGCDGFPCCGFGWRARGFRLASLWRRGPWRQAQDRGRSLEFALGAELSAQHNTGFGQRGFYQCRFIRDRGKALREEMGARAPCLQSRLLRGRGDDQIVKADMGAIDIELARHAKAISSASTSGAAKHSLPSGVGVARRRMSPVPR